MKTKESIKLRLKQGEVVLGTWCTIPSPSVVNVIAAAGLDFVIIDMEHGSHSFQTAEDMIRAAEVENCAPIIRVSKNDDSFITCALDIGAHGVIVPHIETVEDAKNAVDYVKYHPFGHRGFSPYTRAGGYSKNDIDKHTDRENKKTMTILLIEGIKGIHNIDEIIGDKYVEKHVDVIYIGQYDLSQVMGIPGKVNDPRLVNFMMDTAKKIRKKGIAVGTLAHNPDEMKFLIDLGFQFIVYLVDVTVLFHAYNDVAKEYKGEFQ